MLHLDVRFTEMDQTEQQIYLIWLGSFYQTKTKFVNRSNCNDHFGFRPVMKTKSIVNENITYQIILLKNLKDET